MISRLTAAVLLVTVWASLVRCEWAGAQINKITEESAGGGCFELPDSIKLYCGNNNPNYTHTYLPNARGHTTIRAAFKEFFDFQLAIDGCSSDHLGVLLCYYYFPWSTCGNSSRFSVAVKACSEVCEDAHAECTDWMRDNKPDGEWVGHLRDCSALSIKNNNEVTTRRNAPFEICVSKGNSLTNNRTLILFPKDEHLLTPPTTEAPSEKTTPKPPATTEAPSEKTPPKPPATTDVPSEKTTPKPPTTTEAPSEKTTAKLPATTEAPSEKTTPKPPATTQPPTPKETTTVLPQTTTRPTKVTTTEPLEKCPLKCGRPRDNVNGKTYKQEDNVYTFAIAATVLKNITGRLEVNVTENFGLNSPTCAGVPEIIVGTLVNISVPFEHCLKDKILDENVGRDVIIISGVHEDSDGTVTLKLPCGKGNSLIVSKNVSTKLPKMDKFVKAGNKERLARCRKS